jgi:hypothetical protein
LGQKAPTQREGLRKRIENGGEKEWKRRWGKKEEEEEEREKGKRGGRYRISWFLVVVEGWVD